MRFLRILSNSILLLSLCSISNSCIDPYPIDIGPERRLVTVDGLISTSLGPHRVRLTLSNRFNNQAEGNTIPLTGAEVAIRDELGNIVNLKEEIIPTVEYFDARFQRWVTEQIDRPTGIYLTPHNFKAIIGIEYTLLISTADGKSYTSLPEVAVPVPPLEKVVIRPYRFPTINPLLSQLGIYFDAYFEDIPDQKNFYLWRPSKGYGILKTYPEQFKLPAAHIFCPRCPAPKNCCSHCFLQETRLDGTFEISDDFFFDGLSTYAQTLFIVDDGFRFMERYRVQLNQYSISERAYGFLKLVKQQLESKGSVFDPPPANIRGNMLNLDDQEEQVLGYFFVTDVSSKMLYINRSDIPGNYLQPVHIIEDDCREFFGFTGSFLRTGRPNTVPPEDWERD